MSPENNNNIDATIDALFSDKPAAPGARRPAAQGAPTAPTAPAQGQAQPRPAAPAQRPAPVRTAAAAQGTPGAQRPTQGAPAKPTAKATALTINDLKKALERPQKPVEKEPFWATVLIVSGMVLAFIILALAGAAAIWYFRGAVVSMLLIILLGIAAVAFVVSCTVMLRIIEKGIREIKSKL